MLILILLLTNNSPSNAQMCGQAQLQTCATSSGMCKCCYPGFLGDGTYYLQIKYDNSESGSETDSSGGSVSASIDWGSTQTYSPASSLITTTYYGSATYDDGNPLDDCSASITNATTGRWDDFDCENAASGSIGGVILGCETYGTLTTGGDTTETSQTTNWSGNYSYEGTTGETTGSDSITVSSLFTDEMLQGFIISSMPPYPTSWTSGGGTAFWRLDENDGCGAAGKMKYRFYLTATQLHQTYEIKWHEVTIYPNGTASSHSMSEEVPGNGDPVNGVYSSIREVAVPTAECSISEVYDSVTVVSQGLAGS